MTKYVIQKSHIHGKGIFSTENINKNEIIGECITFYMFTIPNITSYLGKWINHSDNSNCYLKYYNNFYYLIAKNKINKNTELTLNYDDKDIPWYIQGSMPWYK